MTGARPRRRDGLATRARIQAQAAELFATTGYRGTSLRQIATAAAVDLATLKYHFGTKAELFARVYRDGHGVLVDFLLPLTRQLTAATTTTQLESAFEQQTAAAARYLRDNTRWVRMTLFRLLEQPDEVVVEEDQLQREMLDLVDACLVRLRDRGLIRPVDTRALVVMLVTALPAWFLAARARPSHVSLPDSGEGLDRTFRALFTPLLRRLLLP